MKSLGLAILTGLLFALSLPPVNTEGLGWVAFVPLLIAARRRRALEAMGLGLIAGIVCGVCLIGWNKDTERLFWGYFPFFTLALLFGLVTIAAAKTPAGLRGSLFLACLGVTLEWLTTFTPLPVNSALCQFQMLPIIQIAALTGIWGVSFLLWLANSAIADAIHQRRLRTPALGVTLALVGLSYAFGLWELRQFPEPKSVRVAAIQDFSGDETGDLAPAVPNGVPNDRDLMTRNAARNGAQIAVWSEECLGSGFTPDSKRDPTVALARQAHISLVVGYSDGALPKPHNCAAFVAPDGSVLGVHHKIHLYLGERQAVQAGSAAHAFATSLGRIGLEVCFDSCWTGVTRQIARSGAQLVAMPNYDPPTPHGVLHRLHGAMLPFRAVENHLPFVRADSNGLSQIISAQGRVIQQGPLYAPSTVIGAVSLGDGRGTPFTRFGDWFAGVCLLVTIYALGVSRRRIAFQKDVVL